jgi:hypothetical protein
MKRSMVTLLAMKALVHITTTFKPKEIKEVLGREPIAAKDQRNGFARETIKLKRIPIDRSWKSVFSLKK